MRERQRVELIIAAAKDTKAEDVLVFDMENRSPITDFVLICSGRSQAHVRGITDRVEAEMKKAGYRYNSLEGYQEGSWVLMDYDVILVHVFHPETRTYYDLEELLRTYPCEQIPPEPPGPGATSGDASPAA